MERFGSLVMYLVITSADGSTACVDLRAPQVQSKEEWTKLVDSISETLGIRAHRVDGVCSLPLILTEDSELSQAAAKVIQAKKRMEYEFALSTNGSESYRAMRELLSSRRSLAETLTKRLSPAVAIRLAEDEAA